MTYSIKGTQTIYISAWSFMGIDFWVHRPVLHNGTIDRKGWQFSIDGIPVYTSPEETKAKAFSRFKQQIKSIGWGKERFAEEVHAIKIKNTPAFT